MPKNSNNMEQTEAFARRAYERCHPDDTFDDLKRRSRFTREDKGLLADWLASARLALDEASEPSER